jgi:site-specific recombinase XerD
MKPTDFAHHLTTFLMDYLPAQRNVSPHTIQAYRDAFVLFLRFCRDHHGLDPERLELIQINPDLILAFLDHLTTDRQAAVGTRNHRLAALHAFFRYLQTEEPAYLLQCQRILAIPSQRPTTTTEVNYLSAEEIAAILHQPDLTTPTGRRDAVLLSLLYDTGARVQELIDLRIRDVRLDSPAQVRLTGKGRKQRLVPLMANTVALVRNYLMEHRLDRPEHSETPLFSNRHGESLSRSGVRYILAKYVTRARLTQRVSLRHVSPHTFRHAKAMHLLQAGTPLIIIRDILGHSTIKSTEIYAKADLEMKRQALVNISDQSPTLQLPSWQQDQALMEWLRSL